MKKMTANEILPAQPDSPCTPTHTLDRISTITLDRVAARMLQADARIRAAAADMVDRYYRRGSAPVVPTDLEALEMPTIPPVPDSIGAVLYDWSGSCQAAYSPQYRNCIISDVKTASVRNTATAAQLVAAIRDADEYAALYERRATEYREATAKAIEAHAAGSVDAVRELTALCAVS